MVSDSLTPRGYAVLPQRFRTTPVKHEIEVRNSQFIAHLARVETEDQARHFIESVRREHRQARHVCTAFVLGDRQQTRRSNDDGEPAGTAGAPILEALTRRETTPTHGDRPPAGAPEVRDLSDVCAAVVRYFGGVKLGAGGLVRAYSESVSTALDTVRLVRREPMRIWQIQADPGRAGLWENEFRTAGWTVDAVDYGARDVTVRLALPETEEAASLLESQVAALSGGQVQPQAVGERWVDVTGRTS